MPPKCCRLLFRYEKEGSTDLQGRPGATDRWRDFHLEDISVPRGQLAASCTCPICQARKSSSRTHNGSLKNVNTVKTVQIVTNEEEATEKTVTSNTMCTQCFQARTGVGIADSCTSATRKKNIAEMVSKEEGSEAIVAKVLNDTVVEGQDSVKLKQLKGGKSLTVTLGQKKEECVGHVDAEVAAKLKKELDLSGKDLKKALHILRKGKVKVKKNVIDILEEVGSTLEDEYEDTKMKFEVYVEEDDEEKGKKTRRRRKRKMRRKK